MSREETVHHVEATLARQGWAVYRRALGSGPPLMVAREDVRLTVQVARAAEPGGLGPYPRLERIGDADVLASVASSGDVALLDRRGYKVASGPGGYIPTPEPPKVAVGALPQREG